MLWGKFDGLNLGEHDRLGHEGNAGSLGSLR